MQRFRPSRTAMGAALYRAAHQVLDRPLVFADPLALPVVGTDAARALRSGRDPRVARSGLRAFIAARSRLAEDCLAEAHRRGVRQYVLLGAGLDTFGCRNDHADLRVFEVDQAASQACKRRCLADAGIDVPDSLTFAAVDFEREQLAEGLARAGFDLAAPAQFAMLGVTMYLSREAVSGTLSCIASLPPGTQVVFDYSTPEETMEPGQRAALAAISSRVAAAGEPFAAGFRPGDLHRMLRELGFAMITDVDSAALNSRYFAGRADGLAMTGTARIISARL